MSTFVKGAGNGKVVFWGVVLFVCLWGFGFFFPSSLAGEVKLIIKTIFSFFFS